MGPWSQRASALLADYRARSAWKVGMVSVVLNLLGLATVSPVFRNLPTLRWVFISAGVSLGLGAVLWLTRRRPSVWLGSAATLINQLFTAIVIWTTADHQTLVTGHSDVGVSVFRLGAITAALLGPPVLWVGLAGIAGFLGAQWAWLDSLAPGLRPPGEPSVTLLYLLFAIGLLLYRRHSSRAERAIIQAQTDALALEQLAYKFLAVRDLANTPLQTLVFVASRLRDSSADAAQLAGRIERSVERLRLLMQAFATYESELKWRPGEESFDPLAVLRRP